MRVPKYKKAKARRIAICATSMNVSHRVASPSPRRNCNDVKAAQMNTKNTARRGESKTAIETAERIADATIIKFMVLARKLAIAAAVFSFGSVAVTAAIIAANSANAPPISAIAELMVSTGIFIFAAYLLKTHNFMHLYQLILQPLFPSLVFHWN